MFWKFYFIVLCIVNIFSITTVKFRIFEFVDTIFSIIFLLGFWGMAWQKKIWEMSIWKTFFICFIFWNVIYTYFITMPIFYNVPQNFLPQWLIASINLFIFAPGILALYFYSFKNTKLWEKT